MEPSLFNAEKYVAGSHIDGFTVEKITPIPEFDLSAVELKHAITGAQYIHLARQDTNNVFWLGVFFILLCTGVLKNLPPPQV